MALFKSQLVTQISGSVGGTTYAHTSSGLYMRARTIPVNPSTGFQLQVRSSLTALVTEWLNTLTPAQRTAWALWASNVPFTNKLGDPFNITGQNAYVGANTARLATDTKLAIALGRIDAGPVIFDRGDFTTPTPSWSAATGLSLIYNTADDFANEDAAAMLIYQGAPQNPSRNFFKGPYRLVHAIEGDSISPPASPVLVSLPTLTSLGFIPSLGQNQWLGVVVVRADGRWSTRRIIGPDVVAA